MKPDARVNGLTGKEMNLFRPPYGDYKNTLIEATKECGYHYIQWDVELLETKIKDGAGLRGPIQYYIRNVEYKL